jgi:hypothetical protein
VILLFLDLFEKTAENKEALAQMFGNKPTLDFIKLELNKIDNWMVHLLANTYSLITKTPSKWLRLARNTLSLYTADGQLSSILKRTRGTVSIKKNNL